MIKKKHFIIKKQDCLRKIFKKIISFFSKPTHK